MGLEGESCLQGPCSPLGWSLTLGISWEKHHFSINNAGLAPYLAWCLAEFCSCSEQPETLAAQIA